MRTAKRFLTVLALLVLCLTLMAVSAFAAEEVASGTCGENLTWVLDDQGTLTISGTGEMNGFYWSVAPWYDYRDFIESIVIHEGVADIGDGAFALCTNLTSVGISGSVTSVGCYAFSGCTSLTSIAIPESVASIDYGAFSDCESLTDIVIPNGVTFISSEVFHGCNSLNSIVIPNGVTSISVIAFAGCTNLTKIVISDSVTWIGDDAFADGDSVADVFYAGSEEDWAQISIGEGNEDLTNATIHYNSTGPCAHKYSSVVTPAQPGVSGYTTHTCSLCGDSYVDSYTAPVMLETPKIGMLENKANGVLITWDAVPNAAKYKLVVKESGGSWKTIWNTVKTSYTWTGAESGKTYTFGIRCTTADGKTYTSAFDSTGKTIQYIARPTIAKVENTATGVKISWKAVPGAAKYKLVVKEPGGSWKTIRYTANTSYTWTGAVSGKTYTFGICCVTFDGKTATSAFDSTGKTIKYVAQPTISKVANMANGVAIAWNKVPGAAKYKIVVKTATSGWKTVAYSTGSTYTWTGAESGVTYTFGIVCVTADGKTVTSAFDSTGKTIKYIACPKIAKLQKVSSGIKITWNKVPGAAKYKLIVKESGGSWKTIWNTINSSYTWTGAVKGKTYIFSIRCTTADGKSYTSGWNSTGWTIKCT